MFEFIWWLMIGLAAGLVARLVLPGRQPIGMLGTLALGLVGSLLGGAISAAIFRFDPLDNGLHPAGFLMATVGAIVFLATSTAYSRRSVRSPKTLL